MQRKRILVTGSSGFIGFHLVDKLLKQENLEIVGIDSIDPYYDVRLKHERLGFHGIEVNSSGKIIQSTKYLNYRFLKLDIAEYEKIIELMIELQFDYVVNLAAQAGVRYSIENPRAYTHSNIDGFLSILEGCRITNVKHLIYASTSSVYGLNTKMPLVETMSTDHPMAFYAATKKANELMAHSYSHLFNIPTTGLRFFTVYGPWGRPDMALFLFADAISKNKPINVFNNGNMVRDFTFVTDIAESIFRLLDKPARASDSWSGLNPQSSFSSAPYQIFNIGNSSPVKLTEYIGALETSLRKKAVINYLPMQPGDVPFTHADVSALERYIDFKPKTSIEEGVSQFVEWYLKYMV